MWHGFGPLTAQDAPSAGSGAQLLGQGYALVGSSYDVNGSWWALNTAVSDQFGSLDAFLKASGLHPRHTLAVGTSMGGLINSLIDQQAYGRVQGAVTFCGLVAGGVDLNNFQLNAEYAMTQLLPGAAGVPIRDYASMAAGTDAGTELSAAVTSAQSSAAGRARIALGAALLNEADWTTGTTPPAANDYAGQEVQEEEMLTSGQLRESPYYSQISALYKAAGPNQHQWTSGVTVTSLNAAANALAPSLGGGNFTIADPNPLVVQGPRRLCEMSLSPSRGAGGLGRLIMER